MNRLVVSSICFAIVSISSAQHLVDTERDFSLTQNTGPGGLTYRWYNKTDDVNGVYNYQTDAPLMTTVVTSGGFTSFIGSHYGVDPALFLAIGRTGMHSHGFNTNPAPFSDHPLDLFAIRRWVADYSGLVEITGEISKWPGSIGVGGNGVRSYLRINGQTYETIDADTGTGVKSSFSILHQIKSGDVLEWWHDSFQANDLSDLTTFRGTVTVVPEPASLTGLMLGAFLVTRRRRPSKK